MTDRTLLRDESGSALVVVVAVGAVLAMLMTMLVALSINGMKQAHSDADWNAALAAAYAGIDEYQSRLSADTSYYRFGNSSSTFANGSILTADSTNPAFGLGAGGTWADVNGSEGRAQFRYEVDNSAYLTSGRIRVRATGKVGDETRTLIADLKQQGFIDFLYFTDLEVQDPTLFSTTTAGCFTDSTKTVMKYAWNGRTTSSSNPCKDVSFGAFDTINGPVHSNDTIRACQTVFAGAVTTGKPTSPYYSALTSTNSSCTAATFSLAGYPAYGGVTGMPETNSQLKKETRTDLTATDVPRPGCLYTGPTQFTFNSNGTVTIRSPFTKKTRIGDANSSTGSEPSECGTISQLQSAAGATITLPDNNVLYVQNVPSVTTDVNYWASDAWPANFTCTSTTNGGWVFGTAASYTAYPMRSAYNTVSEVAPDKMPYGCRAGDAFVQGTFNGAETVAAENYIVVVGDVTYADRQENILGLVGNNAVLVWNPKNSSGALLQSGNRTIEAAILSVAHTFQVQNYDVGPARGTLNVYGAIAQKYRGTVATANSSTGVIQTGFSKNYVYDTRFKYKAPPKFLNPVTTTYGVTTWVETAAVFNADGSAR
ncbi:hypothetical protein [Microbacterium sp.]|uniref:hypothetical protein n=1 Tax=Microbacterium sp. TaxID=51671 RepID=UPI0039E2AF72